MLTALPSRSVWAPPLPGSPNGATDASGAGTSSLLPLSGSPAGAACILTPPSWCGIYALPFPDKMSAGFSQRQARDGAEPELRLPPQPWPWRRRAQPHKAQRRLPAAPRGVGGGGRGQRGGRRARPGIAGEAPAGQGRGGVGVRPGQPAPRRVPGRGWARCRGAGPARWGCAETARPEPAVPPWARGGRGVAVPGGTAGPAEERTDMYLFKKRVN